MNSSSIRLRAWEKRVSCKFVCGITGAKAIRCVSRFFFPREKILLAQNRYGSNTLVSYSETSAAKTANATIFLSVRSSIYIYRNFIPLRRVIWEKPRLAISMKRKKNDIDRNAFVELRFASNGAAPVGWFRRAAFSRVKKPATQVTTLIDKLCNVVPY